MQHHDQRPSDPARPDVQHAARIDRRALLGGAAAGFAAVGLAPAARAAGRAEDAEAPTRSAIRRVRLPRSGELVPCIGLGTSRTFDRDPATVASGEHGDLVQVMDRFLAWGGSVVDSSPMYGRAEAMVGALSRAVGRADLFQATKVWTDEGREAGVAQMERSAELMGLAEGQAFDLLQVHNLVGLETHLETLRAWRAEGRVRYVGVTEMRDWETVERLVTGGDLDFVQLPYNVLDRRIEERLLPACIEHGVAVLVMRPYQAGRLFQAAEGRDLPGWAADVGAVSWGQLYLKWILGHPAAPLPIPATSKPHHLDDNMAAGVGPALDERQRKALVELLES